MAFGFYYKRILQGLNLIPKSSTGNQGLGDMEVLSSDNKAHFHNGTSSSPVVTEDHTATLTNKTLSGNTAASLINGSGTFNFNSTGTLTAPNATDTLVGKATTDTLTNKTLSGNTAASLVNGTGTINFNSSGTITVPSTTDTLVGKATTDTLTNKTLTSPTINTPTISSPTITSPTISNSTTTLSGSVSHIVWSTDGGGNIGVTDAISGPGMRPKKEFIKEAVIVGDNLGVSPPYGLNNSYMTGLVTAGNATNVGALIGANSTLFNSTSTGFIGFIKDGGAANSPGFFNADNLTSYDITYGLGHLSAPTDNYITLGSDGSFTNKQAVTPVSPSTGYNKLYFKSDNNLYSLTSGGVESVIGGSAPGVPTGAIFPYAASSAPTGYLLCDGSAVSRTTYSALFAIIGITHGQGNGSTTFNVPDYRGRFLRGVTGSSSNDPDSASRTAMATGGNTGNNVGSVQGHAFQTHNHGITDPGHSHTEWGFSGSTGGWQSGNPFTISNQSTGSSTTGITINNASASGGTAQSSSNESRPVNAYVQYIIKT